MAIRAPDGANKSMNTEIAVNIKGLLAEPWKKVENIFFLQKSIYTSTPKKNYSENCQDSCTSVISMVPVKLDNATSICH